MPSSLMSPAVMIATITAFALSAAAYAQPIALDNPTYHTFTSGGSPIGDGLNYPSRLDPAFQFGSGFLGTYIAPSFSATSAGRPTSFANGNGRPIFFDNNNLLTRPATLINGDALWTDPLTQTFDIGGTLTPVSELRFGVLSSLAQPLRPESFGFDIAIASAAVDVPTSLPWILRDTRTNATTSGRLLLDDAAPSELGDLSPVLAGEFFSLRRPRLGREARFRLDLSTFDDLLYGGASQVQDNFVFRIDLQELNSLGGTSQIAVDNWVTDGAVLPVEAADPRFLGPLPYAGPNRPQTWVYAAEDSVEANAEGDVRTVDTSDFGPELKQLRSETLDAVQGYLAELDARAYTISTDVWWGGDALDSGLSAHEVTHGVQSTGSAPAGSQAISEEASRVQNVLAPNDSTNLVQNLIAGGEAGNDPAARILSLTGNGSGDTQAASILPPQIVQVTNVLSTMDDPDSQRLLDFAAELFDDPRSVSPLDPSAPAFLLIDDQVASPNGSTPRLFAGYSVQNYLNLLETMGQSMALGDSGYTLAEVDDVNGDPITFRVVAWTVTDQSGTFATYATGIPEPSSLALLTLGGLLIARRRRG